MSGFSAEWLELRERADMAARSPLFLSRLREEFDGCPSGAYVDLATGTGAHVRALAPLLGRDQHWLVVDHDADLLAALPGRFARWAHESGGTCRATAVGCEVELPERTLRVEVRRFDLARDLDAIDFTSRSLVCASALLDLVSREWLGWLVSCCREAGCAAYFALTYDGRVSFAPPAPWDGLLVALLNEHQRRDKGLGPAMGPAAAQDAPWVFEHAGFQVELARSDWLLAGAEAGLQMALVSGWCDAVREIGAPAECSMLAAWLDERRRHIAAGRSRIRVGHVDLLARPLLSRRSGHPA